MSCLQTLLRVGRPISQLAYVEVHLHVQPSGHVKCELVRVSQHSKALQALGLQDSSPAKPAAQDSNSQPAEAVRPQPEAQHAEDNAPQACPAQDSAAELAEPVVPVADAHADMLGSQQAVDVQATESSASAKQTAADVPRPASQYAMPAANDLSPRAPTSQAASRHQR